MAEKKLNTEILTKSTVLKTKKNSLDSFLKGAFRPALHDYYPINP